MFIATRAPINYPQDFGWRRPAVCALLGLRPPLAEHTEAESSLLRRYAQNASAIVELGVAEGGSARLLGEVVKPGGTLYLVDPYPPGRILGINMRQLVARRSVNHRDGATVRWVRKFSSEAAQAWDAPIDFLFIDADHRYEAVRRDWEDWSRFVVSGGHVALHDARLFEGGWTTPESGPVRLVPSIATLPGWRLVEYADSTVVFRRT